MLHLRLQPADVQGWQGGAGDRRVDKPEFTLDVGVGLSAAINLELFKGGLKGGIEFSVDADMQDIAMSKLTKDENGNVTNVQWVSDGKIRGSEIYTMYNYHDGGVANLFNLHAELDFVASAFLKVFVLVGYTQVFEKELFRTTLFEFDYEAPHVQPTLAHVEGGTLYLHSGPNAGDREYFNIDDTNETFILSGSGGHVNVESEDWYLSYDGVTRVVADMGAGDDTFDATRLSGVVVEVDGGDVKDKLYTGSAGGTLRGGPGADQLNGKQGQDTLIGGPGEDRLDGGDGDDRLDGGNDNDNLSGGADNDTYVFVDGWGVDCFGDVLGSADNRSSSS